MDFIYVILILAYIIYNGMQVVKAMSGVRYENPMVLFFFACFIDGWTWIRSKL